MADLSVIIASLKQNLTKATPSVVPRVVTIGGSYPGALSAWFKVLYNDLVDVAYSSSGVIEPIKYFNEFDANIYKALN